MTKHESHIILLLLALITAGVLCYQFVNSGINDRTGRWSYVLLNSNTNHCDFEIEIDIQPPALSGNKAHLDTLAVKNSRGDHYRYSEIQGYIYKEDEDSRNVSSATHTLPQNYAAVGSTKERVQIYGSYLNSDTHLESISLILGRSSNEKENEPLNR